eukprot:TRINITY_DN14935_c0_g1_i2.p1 TRINITY_DN14935_c0_g1~~TRINITY_DN14935_c0_g1_i2.p1  ORF type:complete len:217 (-),score=24.65 TRINITY_DN14935_c0_g1_i2:557-1207(-)
MARKLEALAASDSSAHWMPTRHELLEALRDVTMEMNRAMFPHLGVKEAGMGSFPCCFTDKYDRMAETANDAYMELLQAQKDLAVTGHSEMKNTAPVIKASDEVDAALDTLRPLTSMTPEQNLRAHGPAQQPHVETVQSASQPGSIANNKAHGKLDDPSSSIMPDPSVVALLTAPSTGDTPRAWEDGRRRCREISSGRSAYRYSNAIVHEGSGLNFL